MQFSVSILAAVALAIVFMIILCMSDWGSHSAPEVTHPRPVPTTEKLWEGDKNGINGMSQRLVVATGISSNHYQEAMAGMIGSVQRMMPKTKIIVYDLGLTVEQRDKVSKICGVELRTFNFTKYPDHVSPRTLSNYAWKPLVAAELSKEYEVIMWADSSVRLLEPLEKHVLPYLLEVDLPFVGTQAYQFIAPMTYDKTLKYLNVSRESMRGLRTIQGGCWVIWLTEKTKRLLNNWEDCALHKECIAPDGAKLFGCNIKHAEQAAIVKYCGCHRFDQSALNVILFREFGKEVWKTAIQDGIYNWRKIFAIHRDNKYEYPVAYCA